MPRVTFLPAGTTADCSDGETVFEVGRRSGIAIETACVGKASCGLCRVRIVAGEENLSPQNDEERKHLGNVYFITRVRLSCQSIIRGGDVTVELAPKPGKRR
jgi:2Fe-2S ferredoxin